MRRLQSVLNAAAWLIFGLRRSDHISDALISLRWLRISERVKFKVGVLTYNVLHGRAPSYLGPTIPSWPTYLVAEISDPLVPAASFKHLFIVPPSAAEHFRLLTRSSGTLYRWRCMSALEIFHKRLKTIYLFTQSFPDIHLH